MLVVDPVKRITIAEIRQRPWFNVNLPSYLRPNPVQSSVDEDQGPAVSEPVMDDTLSVEPTEISLSAPESQDPPPDPAMVSPDLGVIDPLLLEELLGKVEGLSRHQVLEQLRAPNTNQIKVAYQLCRDYHNTLEMAANMLRDLDLDEQPASSPGTSHPSLSQSPSTPVTTESLSRSSSVRTRARRASSRRSSNAPLAGSASPMHYHVLIKRSGAKTDLRHADDDGDGKPRSRRTSTASRRYVDEELKTRVNELMASVEDEVLEGSDIDEEVLEESDDSDEESDASSTMSDSDEEYASFDMVDDLSPDDPPDREPLQECYMHRSAHLAVLESSLPAAQRALYQGPDSSEARASQDMLLAPSLPLQAPAPTRRGRSQWHFGIRSRSSPMEIMLVLYRTMEQLGMEWCSKTPLPPVSRGLDALSPKEKQQVLDALTEDVFYAQTQCVMYDRTVRMDLQLYRADANSYLVDFRNVGYAMTPAALDAYGIESSPTALALCRDVQSPFLFFDVVFRLIVELAGG